MKCPTILANKMASGFLLGFVDSARYVSTQVFWMRLAGIDDVAAVFGRWQVLLYAPVLGLVFFVPLVVSKAVGKEYQVNMQAVRYSQALFLAIGVSVSLFAFLGTRPVLEFLNFDNAASVESVMKGFALGGLVHTVNFANQNVFYAQGRAQVAIAANVVAFVLTAAMNAVTFYRVSANWQPLFFGLSLALGEWSKTLAYEIAYCHMKTKGKLESEESLIEEGNADRAAANNITLLGVWRSYTLGLPAFFFSCWEFALGFLTLWRINLVAGFPAIRVMNLAEPMNMLFLLFSVEVAQNHLVDIKGARDENKTEEVYTLYRKLAKASLIMPGAYLLFFMMSILPEVNYYGFKPTDCMIGLSMMALQNACSSPLEVSKRFLYCDKIVNVPNIMMGVLLALAWAGSFLPGCDNFAVILFARTVAYFVQSTGMAVGVWQWIGRPGADSVLMQAERKLPVNFFDKLRKFKRGLFACCVPKSNLKTELDGIKGLGDSLTDSLVEKLGGGPRG